MNSKSKIQKSFRTNSISATADLLNGFYYFCSSKWIIMLLTSDNRLKKLIVIGDRVLIRPSKPDEQTASGLYLPPGVQEKEKVQQGYIIKTGPGYAIPMPVDDEPWKTDEENVKYVPLQAREGDLAIFLVSGATEVMYEKEKYFIVPQGAILLLEREEDL
jgi:co-chaperonin GroES (HSP10)